MSYTYNQIINELKTIALANPFVRRFSSGEITEIDVDGPNSVEYPYCWVTPQGVEIGENTLTYNMRILVFDIDDTDDSKQQELLSDTLQILIDITKNFKYGLDDTILISGTVTAVPFTHRFVDYNSGWYADIKIITEIDNSCNTL
jgi:hypothetical protein